MIDWYRLLPPYWVQVHPTSKAWDKVLNELLDRGPITEIGDHTAKVGGAVVWVANWPYGFGNPYGKEAVGLPKVATRKRLRAAIANALLSSLSPDRGNGE